MKTEKVASHRPRGARWVILLFASLVTRIAPAQQTQQVSSPVTCRGRVLDAEGKPLAGVAVAVVPPDNDQVSAEIAKTATVHSGDDGTFAIELPEGRDREELLFVKRGYVHTVQASDRVALWGVRMGAAKLVAGKVRSAAGPLAGARIVATDYMRNLPFVENQGRGNPHEELRCVERSDASGRFVLDGVYGTALRLQVSALGYRDVVLEPVSMFDPIDVELVEVGRVEGVVRDPDGLVVAGAEIRLGDEWRRVEQLGRSDEKGHFAVTWVEQPAKLTATWQREQQRFRAERRVGEPGTFDLLAGDEPAPEAKKEVGLLVKAKGPDGAPLQSFRVAAYRFVPSNQMFFSDVQQLGEFDARAIDGKDGEATLSLRESQMPLLLLATAEDCAMARVEAAADDQEVEIRFAAEAPVIGRVLEAGTQQPIVGARLWFLLTLGGPDRDMAPLQGDRFATTTEEYGAFALRDVPLGEGCLYVKADGFAPKRVKYTAAAGAKTIDVELQKLVVPTVQCKMAGALPAAFVGVRLNDAGTNTTLWHTDVTGLLPLSRDGALTLEAIPPGNYLVELVTLNRPRHGVPQKVAFGAKLVADDVPPIVLDGGRFVPARATGRVSGPVPLQRLAVISSPRHEGIGNFAFLQYRGPLCPVGLDGTYELQELPGERTLLVVDIVTGAVLARTPTAVQVEPGGNRTQDFELAAAPVKVTVRRGDDPKQSGAMFVELLPAEEFWPGGIGPIAANDGRIQDYCQGMGVVVPADVDTVQVWLPPTSLQAALRQHVPKGTPARANAPHGPIVDYQVVLGRDNAFTVGW